MSLQLVLSLTVAVLAASPAIMCGTAVASHKKPGDKGNLPPSGRPSQENAAGKQDEEAGDISGGESGDASKGDPGDISRRDSSDSSKEEAGDISRGDSNGSSEGDAGASPIWLFADEVWAHDSADYDDQDYFVEEGKDDLPERPPLPKGWPKWSFPPMGPVLEKMLLFVELTQAEEDGLSAAHQWDGLRALIRQIHGPNDPRGWACLSRSARALADYAWMPLGNVPVEKRESQKNAAAFISAGAVAAFRRDGLSLNVFPPVSRPELRPGGGAGETGAKAKARTGARKEAKATGKEGAKNGEAGWDRSAELAFAEKTLATVMSRIRSRDGGPMPPPPPLVSLQEALYPGLLHDDGKDTFPSIEKLRSDLEAAEAPGGPGPASREALVLRSLLGAELWDMEVFEAEEEAMDLMRKSSEGLAKLLGLKDPDTMIAKERYARRLADMPCPWKVASFAQTTLSSLDCELAERLFRSLRRHAPPGEAGDNLRNRAELGGAWASNGAFLKDTRFCFRSWDKAWDPARQPLSLERGRMQFDAGEYFLRFGPIDYALRHHAKSLECRKHVLGGRHPETAASLARVGDCTRDDDIGLAFCAWALAIEALEGRGEQYEPSLAELEYRLGTALQLEGAPAESVPLLYRAEGRHPLFLEERATRTLECLAYLAQGLFWTRRVPEGEALYERIIDVLDGEYLRTSSESSVTSEDVLLSTALAGAGIARILRSDRKGGEEFLVRSYEVLEEAPGESPVAEIGKYYQGIFDRLRHREGKELAAARGAGPEKEED
ncbi:MAG: hypothetical protein LBT40_12825 [Deltaproteobacteria bacterium]|jgi:hypothetical protein|nr:hypothetical protein [Deltaproteobacteria bacterium]